MQKRRKGDSVQTRLCFALTMTFWALFTLFALYALVWNSFRSWGLYYAEKQTSGVSLALAVFLFAGLFLLAYPHDWEETPRRTRMLALPLLLFCLALALRLTVVLFFGYGTEQVSDFGLAFELSKQPLPLPDDHYRIFSNWGLYSAYLRLLGFFTGGSAGAAILGNAVLSAATVVLLYLLAALSLQRTAPALLAALLFNFLPSHLFYTVLLSPEFLDLPLVLLGVLALLLARRRFARSVPAALALCAAGGVSLGLSSFFKPVDKLVYAAVAIAAFLEWLHGRNACPVEHGWRRLARTRTAAIAVCLLFASGTIQAGYAFLDWYAGAPVNRGTTAHFLYMGLNPHSGGSWSEEAILYPGLVRRHAYDYSAADREILGRLSRELRESGGLSWSFFEKKIEIGWADCDYLYFVDMTLSPARDSGANPGRWMHAAAPLCQAYYMGLCLLAAAGGLAGLFRRQRGLWLFAGLLVFGFALLLLVSEVQARYKTVVYPALCLLAAFGADGIRFGARLLWRRIRSL